MAGMHEVIYSEGTQAAVDKAKAENEEAKNNKRVLWRVSSTLFSHIRSNVLLEPLKGIEEKFGEEEKPKLDQYPPIKTIDFVLNELKAISLNS